MVRRALAPELSDLEVNFQGTRSTRQNGKGFNKNNFQIIKVNHPVIKT